MTTVFGELGLDLESLAVNVLFLGSQQPPFYVWRERMFWSTSRKLVANLLWVQPFVGTTFFFSIHNILLKTKSKKKNVVLRGKKTTTDNKEKTVSKELDHVCVRECSSWSVQRLTSSPGRTRHRINDLPRSLVFRLKTTVILENFVSDKFSYFVDKFWEFMKINCLLIRISGLKYTVKRSKLRKLIACETPKSSIY